MVCTVSPFIFQACIMEFPVELSAVGFWSADDRQKVRRRFIRGNRFEYQFGTIKPLNKIMEG